MLTVLLSSSRFRTLQSKISLMTSVLLALALGAVMLFAYVALLRDANAKVDQELKIGERVFQRILDNNERRLTQAAEILSRDFAFRSAVATRDIGTILSAMRNHGSRIGADAMILAGLDLRVIADTTRSDTAGLPFKFPELIALADRIGHASQMVLIDDKAYQLVLVPVLAPDPIAWAAFGFLIDARLVHDLRNLTGLEVSFAARRGQHEWMLVAAIGSTGAQQSAMAALLKHGDASIGNPRPRFDFKDFATQLVPLSVRDDTTFTALLQRDLKDAFEPLQRLSTGLALIGAFTLAVALLFSFWIARSISRPVALLSDLTRKIEVGDYSSSTIVRANDEIGSLANRFDMMREAIAARTSEIQHLNETLEHRIKVRTEELASANRDLEAFSYTVSHDLRAPLRRIDGYALFLVEDHAMSLDEEGRNYLMRIRDSTSKMDRLITDLIAFSRLSRQEIRNEEVDLSALAKQVAASLTDIVPKRNVTWRIEPNLTARADAGLMRIVLDNLLGNAWKYTGKRDRAEIDFFSSNKLAHRRTFCVRDNGAGFDMAYAGNLFQPFKRLHTSQQFEGIGIGLATVRRIVERHGGRIWADGTPDAGATFYFELGADKIIEA